VAQPLLDPGCSFNRGSENVKYPQNRRRVVIVPDLHLLDNDPAERPQVCQDLVDGAEPIGPAGDLGPGGSERFIDLAEPDERGLLRAATMHKAPRPRVCPHAC
jgi:hypothetical protein